MDTTDSGGLPTPSVDELNRAVVLQRVSERLLGEATQAQRIGRYAIIRRLGMGGMGVVYAAYDEELDRRIALKLVRTGQETEHERSQLRKEAQALARLSHPNVVAVHEVGSLDGRTYVAMEYVEGQTLRVWLEAETRGWRDIVSVFIESGHGLAAAHAAGLVHRDFKPDNVMIGAQDRGAAGRVRVMDFGLARPDRGFTGATVRTQDGAVDALDTPLTQSGAVVGTPAYMAPEQMEGTEVGPAADQFSFCVALFEALWGARPFEGATVQALGTAILDGDVRSVPSSSPVPRHIRAAVLRGLQAAPQARWASMDLLVAELQRDPTRRLRRWMLGTVGVGTIAGAAVLARPPDPARPCSLAAQRMDEAWTAERRASVVAGLDSSGVADAEQVAAAVAQGLDDYAASWTEHRVEACEATRVLNVQSEAALDLRMRCLDDRAAQFEALATILETAERGVGNRARLAVAQLPTLARCDDTDVLSADVPPPDDLGEAKVATQVREEIRQVAALRSTGKVAAGLEQAQQTLETARTIDHAPTEVVALAALGHMQEASGDNEAATETLSTAYFAAVESGQRQVAQAAARGLTFVFGVRLNDGEAGLRWGRQALAWARWIEPGGEPEADTHLALAKVYYRQGTLTESLHEGETALAQLGDAYGPDHPRVADAHLELSQVTTALGDLPRAQEHLRKALAVQTERLGSTSLFVAKTQMLLGRLAETTGDVEGSVEAYTATVDILERVYDGDHTNVAVALANLAGALQLQRRYDEALALMTRAQGIFERKVGPDHPNTGHILGAIGALNFTIGNDDEAQRLLERSIEIETAAFGPNHRNLAVSLLHLGRLHKKASRYAEAIAHFERAVAIHHSVSGPDAFPVAAPLSALGICLVEAGRPAEAIAHLEKALGLLGKDATTMGAYIEGGHALARAYESMGRPRTESRARVRDALVAARRIDSKRIDELEAWLEAHPAE